MVFVVSLFFIGLLVCCRFRSQSSRLRLQLIVSNRLNDAAFDGDLRLTQEVVDKESEDKQQLTRLGPASTRQYMIDKSNFAEPPKYPFPFRKKKDRTSLFMGLLRTRASFVKINAY